MIRRLALGTLLHVAAVLVVLLPGRVWAQSTDELAIRRQMAAYEDARKRGDAAGHAALLADDGDSWFAFGDEWQTGTAFKEGGTRTADPRRRVEVQRVTFLGPDAAVVDARYSGGTNSGHGIYIFVKRDSRWLIRAMRIIRDYPITSKDPIVGRWTLNLEKSRFDPSFPVVRSQTRTYEDRGDGLVVARYEAVGADGRRAFTHYAYRRDGQEYPELVRGAASAATIAFTAVDEFTSSFVIRQDGEVTTTGTVTVSADGRTMTNRTDAKNAAGQPIVNIAVYDRAE